LVQRKHKPFLKLTYFDIPGLAEAIRLSFHVAAIPFVDERLTQEQFKAAKGISTVNFDASTHERSRRTLQEWAGAGPAGRQQADRAVERDSSTPANSPVFILRTPLLP
jgi:hypothetical protein